MKLTITLHYNTQWGESLHLAFSPVANVHSVPTLPMHTDGEGRWFITVEGDYKPSAPYTFVVMENGNIKRTEWRHHTLPDTLHGHVHISDRWVDRSELAPFYSSAFTRAIFAHDTHSVTPHGSAGICLCCEAPTLRKNQILAVCGDAKALGAWDTHHARIMEPHGTEWQLWLDKSELGENCEFKFIILEKSTDNGCNESHHPEANNCQLSIINYQLVSWEPGDNRTLHIDHYSDVSLRVLRTYTLRDPQEPWRGAGVAIPVFSLRSKKSFGIGEFSDIPLMVDWAAKTGQCFLQLLPVNDTTMNRNWHESYPYNAITCFALNPMYIRLEEVGVLTDKEAMKEFRKQQKELNKLPQVDFDAVVIAKWDYLHRIFAQEGEQTLASPSYKRFFKDNESWLVPYAEFCCIRDSKNPKETGLYLYIQYHLHKQLKHAADYAHKHGVVLKGDIPIGISRTFTTPATADEDLVLAHATYNTGIEETPTTVAMNFEHMLAKIYFKVHYDTKGNKDDKFTLKEFSISNIKQEGTLQSPFNSTTVSWSANPLQNIEFKWEGEYEFGNELSLWQDGLMLIPQTISPGVVNIRVKYTFVDHYVVDGVEHIADPVEKVVDTFLPAITWSAGQQYTYTMTLHEDDLITFKQIEVATWGSPQQGGAIIIK